MTKEPDGRAALVGVVGADVPGGRDELAVEPVAGADANVSTADAAGIGPEVVVGEDDDELDDTEAGGEIGAVDGGEPEVTAIAATVPCIAPVVELPQPEVITAVITTETSAASLRPMGIISAS